MSETPGTSCRSCGRAISGDSSFCDGCGALGRSRSCDEHPTHVAERACVVCGRVLCRDCDCGSRFAALCSDHGGVKVTQGWAEVWRTSEELEAEFVATELRGCGTDSMVLSQKDHANVVSFGALSVVRVLVPAPSYPAALEVVAAIRSDLRTDP